MEITLTLDEGLVERARAYAEQRRTTLSGLLQELIEDACRPGAGDEFVRLARALGGLSEAGWRFDREACHAQDRGR